jgi:hypothetical protein
VSFRFTRWPSQSGIGWNLVISGRSGRGVFPHYDYQYHIGLLFFYRHGCWPGTGCLACDQLYYPTRRDARATGFHLSPDGLPFFPQSHNSLHGRVEQGRIHDQAGDRDKGLA